MEIFDWIWFYNHGRIKGKRKTIEYINYKEKYGKKDTNNTNCDIMYLQMKLGVKYG